MQSRSQGIFNMRILDACTLFCGRKRSFGLSFWSPSINFTYAISLVVILKSYIRWSGAIAPNYIWSFAMVYSRPQHDGSICLEANFLLIKLKASKAYAILLVVSWINKVSTPLFTFLNHVASLQKARRAYFSNLPCATKQKNRFYYWPSPPPHCWFGESEFEPERLRAQWWRP